MMTTRRLLTGTYWADTVERMIRAAASSALAALTARQAGLFDVAWTAVVSVAGMAAVVSMLTSVAAGTTGDPQTAGFTTGARKGLNP
ncbi:holin [Streptosporangium sp. NPDC020072]|uniref:holin n=1 Tax=Streptosporangium sp. NPDC020072 TaxID=3154788 RepID=UPI0034203789